MALIYLRHPIHGVKIASLEQEAEHDETHGWERYTPGEEASTAPAPDVNALTARPRRRREYADADHSG